MDNQVKYAVHNCHTCGMDILVDVNRTSPRNYCSPCAWAKLGETNTGTRRGWRSYAWRKTQRPSTPIRCTSKPRDGYARDFRWRE